MAVINITATSILAPDGRPVLETFDCGTKMAKVKFTIPINSTYSTTDRCALIHSSGNDMRQLYGATFIRQVMFDSLFGAAALGSGGLKGVWFAGLQKLMLIINGNTGAAILNEQELTNATALGATVITAEARVFFN
jgi:hypothetical protein